MCGYVMRVELNMNTFRSLFGAAILALASLPANAALMTYTDRGLWEGSFSGPFNTETFDSLKKGANSITFDQGIVSLASSVDGTNEVSGNFTSDVNPSYRGRVGNGAVTASDKITWSFPELTFGFFGDFYGVMNLSVLVGSESFDIPGSTDSKGRTTFGMLSAVSFSEITWRVKDAQGDDDLFGIDNFSYVESAPISAVPVPSALWLFGTGLLGLIGFSRRSKAA